MRLIFIQLFTLISIIGMVLATNGEVDLTEANVTNTTFTKLSGQEYSFSVTLYHDDDDEDGYADAWQVEELNGNILGTRILTHAHGTVEFTRSHTISVPDKVDTVVIRGHDQIHGLGGQVMILSLSNNSQVIINQGANPLNFSNFTFLDYIDLSSLSSITSLTFDTLSSSVEGTKDTDTNGLNLSFYLGISAMIVLVIIIRFRNYDSKNA